MAPWLRTRNSATCVPPEPTPLFAPDLPLILQEPLLKARVDRTHGWRTSTGI
jgi:hypothetical protein